MPRKQNGWGNPKSLGFKGAGRVDKGVGTNSFGSYPRNNQYGSTVTRSVTEHFDLNSDWKAWRRGYDLYSHAKLTKLDFSVQYEVYSNDGAKENQSVYIDFYQYPSSDGDTSSRIVAVKYTDILPYPSGLPGSVVLPFDTNDRSRSGVTNVFKVKNEVSDYASEAEYLAQKASGEIPIVLNYYPGGPNGDNSATGISMAVQAVKRAQGTRLTDGYYSGNLKRLEDHNGKPLTIYGRTYNNVELLLDRENTHFTANVANLPFEDAIATVQEGINTATYTYTLKKEGFEQLAGKEFATAQEIVDFDATEMLENLIGKQTAAEDYFQGATLIVTPNSGGGQYMSTTLGLIYVLRLDLTIYRNMFIYDIEEFPKGLYKNTDLKVLYGPPPEELTLPGFGNKPPINEIPIEDEDDPDNGSVRLTLKHTYVFKNSEYEPFYNRIPTYEDLDEIFQDCTFAFLGIESAKIVSVEDLRSNEILVNNNFFDDTRGYIKIECQPVKQRIELSRALNNDDTTCIGIFDSTSFSLKTWSNGRAFYADYTSNDFKYGESPNDKDIIGSIELAIDPWSIKHRDDLFNYYFPQDLKYDVVIACSCPAYNHSISKSPEDQKSSRKNKNNRQNKYPLATSQSNVRTSDFDEQSVAGNSIEWNDNLYKDSHKNCKHTISTHFHWGLDVKEPLDNPTQKAQDKFLEKLFEERNAPGYIEPSPETLERGSISNIDLSDALINSLKIPVTEAAQSLQFIRDTALDISTHVNWLRINNGHPKLININPPLSNGSTELDIVAEGDGFIFEAGPEFSNNASSYTFQVDSDLVLQTELRGSKGYFSAKTGVRPGLSVYPPGLEGRIFGFVFFEKGVNYTFEIAQIREWDFTGPTPGGMATRILRNGVPILVAGGGGGAGTDGTLVNDTQGYGGSGGVFDYTDGFLGEDGGDGGESGAGGQRGDVVNGGTRGVGVSSGSQGTTGQSFAQGGLGGAGGVMGLFHAGSGGDGWTGGGGGYANDGSTGGPRVAGGGGAGLSYVNTTYVQNPILSQQRISNGIGRIRMINPNNPYNYIQDSNPFT